MENMSFWEKVDHLWYCYKLYIIVIFVTVVMLGGLLVSTISYQTKDRLIYAMMKGEEERWPIAVKITDIPFVKDNVNNKGDIYFGLSGREPNLEMCRNVWEYIHAWEPQAEQ